MNHKLRFYYLPLTLCTEADGIEELLGKAEVEESHLKRENSLPSQLLKSGLESGDYLALHNDEATLAVARVLSLAPNKLHWKTFLLSEPVKLPMIRPEIEEVKSHDVRQFLVGMDLVLMEREALSQLSASRPNKIGDCSPTNLILYGPPGTGKTFNVNRRALALIWDHTWLTKPAEELQKEWTKLQSEGQIEFCTFHQNYSYEEFVEGLRARTDDSGNIRYQIEDGIFKRLATLASAEGLPKSTERSFDELWELMIEGLEEDGHRICRSSSGKAYQVSVTARGNVLTRACTVDAEDNVIDLTDKEQRASKEVTRLYWDNRQELGPEPNKLSYDKTTSLISRIKGGSGGNHYTAVWIAYSLLWELDANTRGNQQTQQNPIVAVRAALEAGRQFNFSNPVKQFVLVIDEVNRGNMSKIFGELITLLESDKRLGSPNQLIARLPNSNKKFGVPPNLHIIGTMNTADRSIALMDVALRRRFDFEEMMPDTQVIRDVLAGTVEKDLLKLVVNVSETINERLVFLYDREHQIGHAYYLKVKDLRGLQRVFATKIIPLLQEYFYGQWNKVAICLGYPMDSTGMPTEDRQRDHQKGTVLICRRLGETNTIGFDHDEYSDMVVWDVHPAFKPGTPDFESISETFLEEAFREVVKDKNQKPAQA